MNNLNLTPNLFGLPYQFTKQVDPRVQEISTVMGKEFTNNMLLEAPVCTFIPGRPSYLSNSSVDSKIDTSMAILSGNENFSSLPIGDREIENFRLYDFKSSYTEYIKYVNILCRAGAAFLDINETITIGSYQEQATKFNWANFKWSKIGQQSVATNLSSAVKKASQIIFDYDTHIGESSELDELLSGYNFVQFYVDADVGSNESMGNSTSESQLKSLFEAPSGVMKEIAFMANSGMGDDIMQFADESADALTAGINDILGGGNGAITGCISRILNLGGEVLKGNNIIIPDIYQSSSYSKNYSITVHLKSPYGSKLGYYLNVFVPLMHIVALVLPKQATANSYESPFIVKAFVDGIFSCNMGIVEGISISKSSESWSVDGLPTEVDVSIDLKDLYSSMNMTPSSSPNLFVHNSSLVEYLAVNCGLDLTKPNLRTKLNFEVDTILSSFEDIGTNVKSKIEESFNQWITSNLKLYK